MKKLFTLFLALIASAGTMFAASGSCGKNLRWNLASGVLTISGTGAMTEWYDYSDVPWYSYRNIIKGVTIGNSVKSIGGCAFAYCTGLTSIEIPDSIISIGGSAFYGCSGLTSVTIPNSVTRIGVAAFNACSRLTTITIGDSVTSIGNLAFSGCCLTSVEIPNSVTSIGYGAFDGSCLTNPVYNTHVFARLPTSYSGVYTIPNGIESIAGGAFEYCSSLTNIIIPNSVTGIGGYRAFYCCNNLASITCEAVIPPLCGGDVFGDVNKSIPLYVLANSVNDYKAADVWKTFTNIQPIQAEVVEITTTTIVTTESTANVAWQQINDAYSYELIIHDANGNVICTLVFDAEGHLLSLTFNAPNKDHAPQQLQSVGFAFTVTGLDSGTTYHYTLTAKNESGSILNAESGSFTTASAPQAIDEVSTDNVKTNKLIRNGQILIEKNGKTYTLTGQELR